MEPKEQVPPVEQSTRTLEEITIQTNETDAKGRELEDSNGKACHHRKGGSLSGLL